MNDIERFSFFKSYFVAIEKLRYEASKMEMSWAILNYVFYNKEPVFSNKEKELKEMAWSLIEPNLRASKKKANNAKKR